MGVECRECGNEFQFINGRHLKTHNMTTEEYKEKYPNAPRKTDEYSKKLSENNSMNEKKYRDKVAKARREEAKRGMNPQQIATRNGNNPAQQREVQEKLSYIRKAEVMMGDHPMQQKEAQEKVSEYQTGEVHLVECTNCDLAMFRNPHHVKGVDTPYCSVECLQEHRRVDNHPNWRGGKSFEDYPPEFSFELKEEIRNLYDRKCIICQTDEDDIMKESLPIHHIDYNKDNNSRFNLVPVCCSCHMKTNDNRRSWEQYINYIIGVNYGKRNN
jgi:hypothetical protein